MASTSTRNQTSHATKWDVFLSFRGIDTRDSFTDFLYHSLDRTGIRTFRDDPELRTGEVISDALLQAIHDSKTYVVVFSKNYASSPWCLDELVEILDCHQSMSRLVLPVFYNIEPSVVKYQTGSFKKAFLKHESDETRYERDRLDKWRNTLKQVGKFSGYHVRKNMSQADVINEIVDRVLNEVNPGTLDVAKYQVGLDSRVKDIETLLRNITAGVTRVGIYGMGGVGKTTLAKAVYNQIHRRFKGSCFLENVRETSQTRKGIVRLQQKLVNDVLKCKNMTIDNADQGIELIRDRICSTKILVVIDDLDSKMAWDFLVGTYALESTVIITTRDEHLLDSIKVDAKYKVNVLGDAESRQLFCQHAFEGDNKMPDTLSELSKEILKRAGGLPLALKVSGSTLLNEHEEGWRWYIEKLRRDSIDVNVEKILLSSFDALKLVDPMLQDIFLDIASFFIGYEEEEVVKILITCYPSVNYSIDILKKRSLLIDSNSYGFRMHDLLIDMGRKIVYNNSPELLEKHSRLWVPEDIHQVLKENKGTEAIEGIIPNNFDLPRDLFFKNTFEQESSNTAASIRNHFATQTFKRMSKLRFLYLDNVDLTGSFENTFKDLRWLYWSGCNLKCLPSEFFPAKLVCLGLPGNKMRTMWELNTVFENLKTLDLSYSAYLTTTPDFTQLPILETLNLAGCKILTEVHVSIGNLVRLVSLNLWGCTNLKSLPDSICNLRVLKSLNITCCFNLEAIPLNLGNIESLEELKAEYLTVGELPHSIGHLSKLIELNLSTSKNLKTLAYTICNLRSLKILDIDWCWRLEALPTELGNLESLVELKAEGLTVSKLPDSIGHLSKLMKLHLKYCRNLKTLPDTICNLRSLRILYIVGCSSLEALPIELGNLESLVELNAAHLPTVSKLPDSIGLMESLENLSLRGCFNLLSIAELPCSLKSIDLEGCKSMERLPNLSNMKQLEDLELTDCSGLTKIQGLEELTSIKILHLGGCNSSMLACTFTKRLFEIYSGFGHRIRIYASQSVFPEMFSPSSEWIGQSTGFWSNVFFNLAPNLSENFLAMILCYEDIGSNVHSYSIRTTTEEFYWSLANRFHSGFSFSNNYNSCIDIVPKSIFSITKDDERIEFTNSGGLTAVTLWLHLLYKTEFTIIVNAGQERTQFSERWKNLWNGINWISISGDRSRIKYLQAKYRGWCS